MVLYSKSRENRLRTGPVQVQDLPGLLNLFDLRQSVASRVINYEATDLQAMMHRRP